MRARHLVTVGIGVGAFTGLAVAFAGCGESTFGTCQDTASCEPDGGSAGDGTTTDQHAGNEGSTGEGGIGDGGVHEGGEGGNTVSCDAATAIACDGVCVDKETDPGNCGSCGHACSGPEAGTGTGVCVGGQCAYACETLEGGAAPDGGTIKTCGSSCVDTSSDPLNCSACGTVCPGTDGGGGSPICLNSKCNISCLSDAGQTLYCTGTNTCVDPTQVANCGGCGNNCPAPTANGAASCVGMQCGFACMSGYHQAGGAMCNTTCSPNTDPPSVDQCVVTSGLGTFVAEATGTDVAGCGATSAAPCKTIAYAMTVAAAAKKRVYACGTFATPVAVTSAGDGVTVYGGMDCATWTYTAGTKTKVTPTVAGYALQVTGATTGVTFVDFEFDAVSASTTPSATPASSIAVFASGATLTLTNVAVTAGSGQPGLAGTTGQNYSGSTAPGGSAPTSLSGGAAGGPNTCQDGTASSGGKGSDATGFASPGTPTSLPSNAGASGVGVCTAGGSGNPGASAPITGTGVTSSGSLSASGWTVAGAGGTGSNGGIGQGGGGGGGNSGGNPGAGGGGGAGGCGGGSGTGGATGGASIGILSFQSTITTTGTSVVTQAGGNGGAGGSGQPGQAPGSGGAGGGTGDCVNGNGGGAGGTGGKGSDGSAGGGGAGGLSSGIVWSGVAAQAPSFNGATYTTAAAPVVGITLGSQGGNSGGNGTVPPTNAIFHSN